MDDSISYRSMVSGEEDEVSRLINRVFDEFVAPGYALDGVQEFQKYVQAETIKQRSEGDHFVLVAIAAERIVGVIEIRANEHLSLLFVDSEFHGRKISREFLQRALDICHRHRPDLTQMSVNSSPYAVPIYERLGFEQTGPEEVLNGIRFVPMMLNLID
jgi:predicted GNAT family N-acyltransferase